MQHQADHLNTAMNNVLQTTLQEKNPINTNLKKPQTNQANTCITKWNVGSPTVYFNTSKSSTPFFLDSHRVAES